LGIVILIGIGIVSAALWHHFVPRFAVATIAATTTTVVLFQIAAYIDLGYLDPFFLIAIGTSGALSLLISVLIGLPMRTRRGKVVPDEALSRESNSL
jgi:hypothetical protein